MFVLNQKSFRKSWLTSLHFCFVCIFKTSAYLLPQIRTHFPLLPSVARLLFVVVNVTYDCNSFRHFRITYADSILSKLISCIGTVDLSYKFG